MGVIDLKGKLTVLDLLQHKHRKGMFLETMMPVCEAHSATQLMPAPHSASTERLQGYAGWIHCQSLGEAGRSLSPHLRTHCQLQSGAQAGPLDLNDFSLLSTFAL